MKNYFLSIIYLVILVAGCAGGAKPVENIEDNSGKFSVSATDRPCIFSPKGYKNSVFKLVCL